MIKKSFLTPQVYLNEIADTVKAINTEHGHLL